MRDSATSVSDAMIPEVWSGHRRECASCQKWVEEKPATLIHVCIRGAPLVKRILEIHARPALNAKRRAERDAFRASDEGKNKATPLQLRQVMRYKGDAE